MAVGHLTGSQLQCQQAQGAGGRAGGAAAVYQMLDQRAAAVFIRECQRIPGDLKHVAASQRAAVSDGDQADPLGKEGGIRHGKVPVFIAVSQHAQQAGAPGVGGDGGIGLEIQRGDAGEPALVGGIIHSVLAPGGHIPVAGEPGVCRRGLLGPGQTHQQHGGLGPGGRSSQIVPGVGGSVDQTQCT